MKAQFSASLRMVNPRLRGHCVGAARRPRAWGGADWPAWNSTPLPASQGHCWRSSQWWRRSSLHRRRPLRRRPPPRFPGTKTTVRLRRMWRGRICGAIWEVAGAGLWSHRNAPASDREDAMIGAGHEDSIVQRGIDEALACQDMLDRTPVRPSLLARLVARLLARGSIFARRQSGTGRVRPVAPTTTITR